MPPDQELATQHTLETDGAQRLLNVVKRRLFILSLLFQRICHVHLRKAQSVIHPKLHSCKGDVRLKAPLCRQQRAAARGWLRERLEEAPRGDLRHEKIALTAQHVHLA